MLTKSSSSVKHFVYQFPRCDNHFFLLLLFFVLGFVVPTSGNPIGSTFHSSTTHTPTSLDPNVALGLVCLAIVIIVCAVCACANGEKGVADAGLCFLLILCTVCDRRGPVN